MRRPATIVILGGWIGFLVTFSAILSCALLRVAEPGLNLLPWGADEVARNAGRIRAGGNPGALFAAASSFAAVALATVLVLAIWMLQSKEASDRVPGERIAAAGLVASGVLVLALRHMDFFLFDSLVSFAAILGLSILAILFDRLIEIEETPDDDEDFLAATILIGQEMARGVARQPPHRDNPSRDRLG